MFFKIRPSQDILKNHDGTPLEAEEILTYIKNPRNGSVWHFCSKLYVPSNVVQKKRVARILFFKIRSSQEILKIHDGTPLEAEEILTYIKRVAQILFFKIRLSQEILKIRDGTPLEAEEILTYIKNPRNGSVWHFSSKLYSHLKIFLKIVMVPFGGGRNYIKSPRNGSLWHFSSKLDVPSNIVQKKRLAWILFFKIMPSQEILKIRDGTPLEAEEILTYIKRPSQDILKNRDGTPFGEILKICDGTPLEAGEIWTYKKALERIEILTYIKNPRNGSIGGRNFDINKKALEIGPRNTSVGHFSSKLDVPSNIVQKKRVTQIMFFKIRPSQDILKNHDGTPLEAEEILTYIKNPRNGSVWHFCSKLYVPSNVVQKKRVARILFFKIRSSQEILKIHDGTPLEAEEILTYIKRVAQILFFKIRLSQEILKIRDGTPLEAEEILTYIKNPRNGSV
ncbi:hypothetical protein OROHE_015362 [Orobanche hederae]